MKRIAVLHHPVRWILSVLLVVLGLLATWAWGQVAHLQAAPTQAAPAEPRVLYAAWQSDVADYPGLFRTTDDGANWQPVAWPGSDTAGLVAWASDGADRLAVALSDGAMLKSDNQGKDWVVAARDLKTISLAWGQDGTLFAGTGGQGVYRLAPGSEPAVISAAGSELARASVRSLAYVDGRLFAATPSVLFYTDDAGANWTKSTPVPAAVTALVAAGRDSVYVGTETVGVFKSSDAGQTWQPAIEGLGLAAGQAVRVTALKADPLRPGVLYAGISYVVGGTTVVASAEGTFVTLDGGESWQELAGPRFPDAKPASDLVLLPDRPLSALAITPAGVQAYAPDVVAAMAALDDADPRSRVRAARLLGMARAREASSLLLASLADGDPAVSAAAANALGQIGDQANAGKLLVALDNPNEQVRLGAAQALGLMKNESAVKPLRDMLMSGDGSAISVAAEALGRIGSPAAIEALLAALPDAQLTARRHAAMGALEGLGQPAVGPLSRMLAGSREVTARQNAAETLGWIGSAQATPALEVALKDRDASVRKQAAWALGEVADPAARSALQRAASRDASSAVQAEAQAALRQIATQPRVPAGGQTSLASALDRLQPVRWLLLILTWSAAAWLAISSAQLIPAPARLPRLRRNSRGL